MPNAVSPDVITVWSLTRWKGSITVTDAGTNKLIEKLEELQAKEDLKFKFLDLEQGEDRMEHIRSLQLKTKGTVNNIFQIGTRILNYPCITKIFATIPGVTKGTFPKGTARDPVTCAQIQYLLYNNFPNKIFISQIENDTMQCRCKCENCYRLAFEEYYKNGVLRCKK